MRGFDVASASCPQEPAKAMEFALWMCLSQAPQSFADLWPTANRSAGFQALDLGAPGYRFTDRWLQAGRRKGWLKFERSGRTPMWSLTDAGRDQFVGTLADAHSKSPSRPAMPKEEDTHG